MKKSGICIARAHTAWASKREAEIEEHDLVCSDKGGSGSAREKNISLS